jgi:hypothetical protein
MLKQFLNKEHEMEGVILHRVNFENCMKTDFKMEDLNEFIFAAAFRCGAESDAEFCDMAFEATNSIDYHWSENDGIETKEPYSKRSTSVGDLIWIETKIYMVANFGFKLVKDTRF